jgi:hypothetical protein
MRAHTKLRRLKREARKLAESNGHVLGRFWAHAFSDEWADTRCVKCDAYVSVCCDPPSEIKEEDIRVACLPARCVKAKLWVDLRQLLDDLWAHKLTARDYSELPHRAAELRRRMGT